MNNSVGNGNTAVGLNALLDNTSGSNNIAFGVDAGSFLTTGNNNIDIGNSGIIAESDTIRIGGSQTKTFIAGIRGVTTGIGNALPVVIDSANQLGTVSSSRRFKNEIKPMDQTSESILGLTPVTFHYKSDKTSTPQFGLIAEEVAEVNPDLVVRDENGEIYTVRYDAVNAMLLNEFLKEHKKVEKLEATVADLAAQLQKVTAQMQGQCQRESCCDCSVIARIAVRFPFDNFVARGCCAAFVQDMDVPADPAASGYDHVGKDLRRSDLDSNPIRQFANWFTAAIEATIRDVNAMSLATAGRDARPSVRIVLLKSFDQDGFVFFTNYESAKGKQLEANPYAALGFYWIELDRQIRISGKVEKTSREESQAYFHSRPVGSQLGAWASRQSEIVDARRVLDARMAEMTERFRKKRIPLPAHWGGYRLKPDTMEFWQGRPNRLHDRFRYTRMANGTWQIDRLAP